VPAAELGEAAERVEQALTRTLADGMGAWLLADNAEAASELALTGVVDGKTVHVQMDRTFVDDQGVRWIVDYKTGSHEGADPQGFLDSEQERYQGQLEQYARIMAAYDPGRPIRLALYFPLLQATREWEWQP
jgi:ATP-dependent exoDNAse (exonuclease V) beta subunit